MKRSEMLLKLNYLMSTSKYRDGSVSPQDILYAIEEAGMLPPEREVVRHPVDGLGKLSYIDYENSWEPEDEEK